MEARKHFLLEEGFTFLNHGAFGATLSSCLRSKAQWAEYVERQPVRFFDREAFPWLVHVTRGLAQMLKTPAEQLLPVPSVTVAMNAVLRSWQRRRQPGPSQRVAMLSTTYGSTKKLVRKLAEESSFQVDEAPLEFPLLEEEQVLSALETVLHPETALVVLDLVPSNAPYVLPLEAVPLVRQKCPEALVLLDAAHGLFGLPMKLGPRRDYAADVTLMNCHKWFCGAKGTALLHLADQDWVEPLVISHGYGFDQPSGFYWPGLADWSSFLALDEAMAFWDLVGIEPARTYCNYLVRDAATMLADAWGTELGVPEELLSTMALVELPGLLPEPCSYEEAERVQQALYERMIEVPVKALSGKLYVRISAHIYNHIEEYELLRDVVLDLKGSDF